MIKTVWGVVFVDIAIITMATTISIWQDNTNYLWLLLLMGTTRYLYERTK